MILTCEHGGNDIPEEYAYLFEGAQEDLASPAGYDLGAQEIMDLLAPTADFTLVSTVSRLLVDLNRTEHHPRLFSEYLRNVPPGIKRKILYEHYFSYRLKVEQQIKAWAEAGETVYHLAVHTFNPYDDGKERNADLGLLYDPSREPEVLFTAKWRQQLESALPPLRIRYNYPKKGTADGMISLLRKQFTADQYVGLELEVNQSFFTEDVEGWKILRPVLLETFRNTLQP